MAKTKRAQRGRAANADRWGKTRAEKHGIRTKPATQRAARGAQQTARHDLERGVTSRARKSVQGTERVADPRSGARPGRRRSRLGRGPKT